MTRWKIVVEYDGAPFAGWQRQANGPSVQAALETAIARFSGEVPTVFGAGRTDSGVHAQGQVAHFDLARRIEARRLCDAINALVRPAPLAVLSAEAVDEAFDARFSARARHYVYRIVNRRAPPVLDRGRVWHVAHPLDEAAMADAATRLVGRHDFTTFRAGECQARSPVKTLDALEVARVGDEVRITARARSFLHHQVRNMAGTLRLVGAGNWTSDDIAAALAARDRARGGPTAPAHGLCLVAVRY